ncbi:hypothetical protein A15U_01488 [Escherichia coli KTE210]|nr:hypothetical protein A15U_01488 [Escherichia coli KTE210]EQX89455.1 hypothetical protein G938_01064 [Escherichia coli UMEA 3200-1]RDP65510.1 hypothetical protein C4A51_01956 [Escherichia coli]
MPALFSIENYVNIRKYMHVFLLFLNFRKNNMRI